MLSLNLAIYKKGVDVGSLFPKLNYLTLTRGRAELVEMTCPEKSRERLSIVLNMDMGISKEELEGLRALHGNTSRVMEVMVRGAQMSQEQYKQLVRVVLGECKSLMRLFLWFMPRQEKLISLEFLTSLEGRGAFPSLKFFEVRGVNAIRMVKSLGAEWVEGMDGFKIKGAWSERDKKWELEGPPKNQMEWQ